MLTRLFHGVGKTFRFLSRQDKLACQLLRRQFPRPRPRPASLPPSPRGFHSLSLYFIVNSASECTLALQNASRSPHVPSRIKISLLYPLDRRPFVTSALQRHTANTVRLFSGRRVRQIQSIVNGIYRASQLRGDLLLHLRGYDDLSYVLFYQHGLFICRVLR